MSSTVMLLGILAAFVLLGYMCMKGWSVYISAPLCAIIIALTSGMGPLNAITESFLPGTGNYLASGSGYLCSAHYLERSWRLPVRPRLSRTRSRS